MYNKTFHLTAVPDALNMRTRLRLMELNRALCLECPEFQVPWFHERYCEHLVKKGEEEFLVLVDFFLPERNLCY